MTPYLNLDPGPDRASKERIMVHEFEFRCRGKLSPGKLTFKRDVCPVLSCSGRCILQCTRVEFHTFALMQKNVAVSS